jgi:uncharacterized protein YhfF
MNAEEMWDNFQKISNIKESYTVWYFGDNERDANELLELVLVGKKKGTSSLYELFEEESEKLPEIGDYSIITNWIGEPACIVITTDINIVPFSEISEEFAYKEGEGDRTLEHWKKIHWEFFKRLMESYCLTIQKSTLVVCEEFELVYN